MLTADSRIVTKTFGRTGLVNFGQTCYFNSTVQCLLHCKPLIDLFMTERFVDELRDWAPSARDPLQKHWRDLIFMFADFIRAVWSGRLPSMRPRRIRVCTLSACSIYSRPRYLEGGL